MVNSQTNESGDDDFLNIMRASLSPCIIRLLEIDLHTNDDPVRYIYEVVEFEEDPENDIPMSVRFYTNARDAHRWMEDNSYLVKYVQVDRNSSCFGIGFNNSNIISTQ
jgi:hypothetical protein